MFNGKFGFPYEDLAAVFVLFIDKSSFVKAHGWTGVPRRIPAKGEEINWLQSYEGRTRRFNTEVIVLALSALAILTGWWFIAEWACF
jgi:hypothetical protein